MSSAAYIKKLNESQKFVREGSEKMVAQFRTGVAPYFKQVK
jgi:hypothetical protein